jgi:glycosyltransferase involved in cell wall biosynthesis
LTADDGAPPSLPTTAPPDGREAGVPLVTVVLPFFDDAASARLLVERLEAEVARIPGRFQVLFVDDGSRDAEVAALPGPTRFLPRVDVLRLRRNLGHQGAIAIGLAAVAAAPSAAGSPGPWVRPDFVVVMDADGEDDPATLPALLAPALAGTGEAAVFAGRLKRHDSIGFLAGYRSFRALHRLLVGEDIAVGNFSVLPAPVLDRVVGVAEIWRHYAAGVLHARIPVTIVPLERGRRLAGRSKMNLPALVLHGISALSVWSDVVAARLLIAVGGLFAMVVAASAGRVGIRLLAGAPLSELVSGLVDGLPMLLVIGILCLLLALFVLGSRNASTVMPHRDWRDFVLPDRGER